MTLLAILLLLVVMGITMVSRKITRGLGWPAWRSASSSCSCWPSTCSWSPSASGGTACAACSPRPCRQGSDATLLGGLAGFTALASGLNWYVMNHYRDKGYGMGSRVGYLAGLRGERQESGRSG